MSCKRVGRAITSPVPTDAIPRLYSPHNPKEHEQDFQTYFEDDDGGFWHEDEKTGAWWYLEPGSQGPWVKIEDDFWDQVEEDAHEEVFQTIITQDDDEDRETTSQEAPPEKPVVVKKSAVAMMVSVRKSAMMQAKSSLEPSDTEEDDSSRESDEPVRHVDNIPSVVEIKKEVREEPKEPKRVSEKQVEVAEALRQSLTVVQSKKDFQTYFEDDSGGYWHEDKKENCWYYLEPGKDEWVKVEDDFWDGVEDNAQAEVQEGPPPGIVIDVEDPPPESPKGPAAVALAARVSAIKIPKPLYEPSESDDRQSDVRHVDNIPSVVEAKEKEPPVLVEEVVVSETQTLVAESIRQSMNQVVSKKDFQTYFEDDEGGYWHEDEERGGWWYLAPEKDEWEKVADDFWDGVEDTAQEQAASGTSASASVPSVDPLAAAEASVLMHSVAVKARVAAIRPQQSPDSSARQSTPESTLSSKPPLRRHIDDIPSVVEVKKTETVTRKQVEVSETQKTVTQSLRQSCKKVESKKDFQTYFEDDEGGYWHEDEKEGGWWYLAPEKDEWEKVADDFWDGVEDAAQAASASGSVSEPKSDPLAAAERSVMHSVAVKARVSALQPTPGSSARARQTPPESSRAASSSQSDYRTVDTIPSVVQTKRESRRAASSRVGSDYAKPQVSESQERVSLSMKSAMMKTKSKKDFQTYFEDDEGGYWHEDTVQACWYYLPPGKDDWERVEDDFWDGVDEKAQGAAAQEGGTTTTTAKTTVKETTSSTSPAPKTSTPPPPEASPSTAETAAVQVHTKVLKVSQTKTEGGGSTAGPAASAPDNYIPSVVDAKREHRRSVPSEPTEAQTRVTDTLRQSFTVTISQTDFQDYMVDEEGAFWHEDKKLGCWYYRAPTAGSQWERVADDFWDQVRSIGFSSAVHGRPHGIQ